MTFIFSLMKLVFMVDQYQVSCPLYYSNKGFAVFTPHPKPKNQPHLFHLDRHTAFQIHE